MLTMHIYGPGNFVPDPGDNGRHYPIPKADDRSDVVCDKKIQQISYNQANLVAIFADWFQAFFEPNYFKFVRIKTQSPFTEFKSFMKNIYKTEKPFLVIDPHQAEIVEDSLFAQNMLNRYNPVEADDPMGAATIYSIDVMHSDLFELVYRRNRLRMEFDVMIMEGSLNRQSNTFNRLVMGIRHNSKFMLRKTVPMLIPRRHIINIARFHGLDWKSDGFLDFLNGISKFPIKREVLAGSGQYMFFMLQDLHVYVETSSFPAKDGPENSEAIEWGARIVDSFTLSADLPAEFLFLTKKEYVGRFDTGIEDDPDSVTFISPIYADLDWPKEINGYQMSNRFDVELQEGDDPTLQILPLIESYDPDIYKTILGWVKHRGKLEELVLVRVYPNGSKREIGSILHDDGVLELVAAKTNKLYTGNIYLNLHAINLIREGEARRYIGTISE